MKPLTSADFDNDFAKERQFIEMGAQKQLRPAPHSHYDHEQTPQENTAEQLHDIQAENVRASSQINYHE